jgi:hypothetical protein
MRRAACEIYSAYRVRRIARPGRAGFRMAHRFCAVQHRQRPPRLPVSSSFRLLSGRVVHGAALTVLNRIVLENRYNFSIKYRKFSGCRSNLVNERRVFLPIAATFMPDRYVVSKKLNEPFASEACIKRYFERRPRSRAARDNSTRPGRNNSLQRTGL